MPKRERRGSALTWAGIMLCDHVRTTRTRASNGAPCGFYKLCW